MTKLNYNNTRFLISAVNLKQLPEDVGIEIAFIGRSNAGKSSAINTITAINGLARISKTPGRTQAINIFQITDKYKIIDLPGYGYTKAPLHVSRKWMQTVNDYLKLRESLKVLILIMDIRHPLKPQDMQIIDWASVCNIKLHILLSKSDKLSKNQAAKTLYETQNKLSEYQNHVTIQLFSSHTKTGLQEMIKNLDHWSSE